MALTAANRTQLLGLSGGRAMMLVDVTLDNSYPGGGGYPSLTQALGLATIDVFLPMQSGGYHVERTPATDKLLVQGHSGASAASEVAAATNLSAVTVRCLVIGRQ